MGIEYKIGFRYDRPESLTGELERLGGVRRDSAYDFTDMQGQHFATVELETDGFYFLDHCGVREPVAMLFYRLIAVASSRSQDAVSVTEL